MLPLTVSLSLQNAGVVQTTSKGHHRETSVEEREASTSHLRSQRSTPIKSISPILGRCLRRQSSETSSIHHQTPHHHAVEKEKDLDLHTRSPSRSSRPGTGSSFRDEALNYSTTIESPSSSPARVRRAAVKRMSSLWSSIKTSSPVRRAKNALLSTRAFKSTTSSKRISVRSNLCDAGRHSFSHPDVSCSNLAELAFPQSTSRDDMALLSMAKTTTKPTSFSKQTSLPESTAYLLRESGMQLERQVRL